MKRRCHPALGAIAFALPYLRRHLIHDVVTWDAAPLGARSSCPPAMAPADVAGAARPRRADRRAVRAGRCTRAARVVGAVRARHPPHGRRRLPDGQPPGRDRAVDRPHAAAIGDRDALGPPARAAARRARDPCASRRQSRDRRGSRVDRALARLLARVEPAKDDDPSPTTCRDREGRGRERFAPRVRARAPRRHRGSQVRRRVARVQGDRARGRQAARRSSSPPDPDARWFLLSDHGHLPAGGHGGEEPSVRQVEGCIAGPGIARDRCARPRRRRGARARRLDRREARSRRARPADVGRADLAARRRSGDPARDARRRGARHLLRSCSGWSRARGRCGSGGSCRGGSRSRARRSSRCAASPRSRCTWSTRRPAATCTSRGCRRSRCARSRRTPRLGAHDDLARDRRAARAAVRRRRRRDHRVRRVDLRCSARRSRRWCRASRRGCRR